MKKGEIDVISHLDPVIAKLEADGDIQVLIDTRTEAGTRALFGGSNPAAVLYTQAGLHREEPEHDAAPRQRLREVAEVARRRATPERGRRRRCRPNTTSATSRSTSRRWQNSQESYSRDGVVPPEGMASALDMLKTLDPELQGAKIDLGEDLRRPLRQARVGLTPRGPPTLLMLRCSCAARASKHALRWGAASAGLRPSRPALRAGTSG